MTTHHSPALVSKFQMGEVVYYQEKKWWITGVIAYFGYEILDWQYQITKPCYNEVSDISINWLGGRMDVDNKTVKEHLLKTEEEHVASEIERLEQEYTKLKRELEDNERKQKEMGRGSEIGKLSADYT